MTNEHTLNTDDRAIDRYIMHLNELGAKQALSFILRDDGAKEFVMNAVREYNKAFPRVW
jgi:hypothetical protein